MKQLHKFKVKISNKLNVVHHNINKNKATNKETIDFFPQKVLVSELNQPYWPRKHVVNGLLDDTTISMEIKNSLFKE